MKKIKFLITLHNHQPCGNFGWVFEEAYNKAYKPFIDTLEKYPKVKVMMHYSGSLLEWFDKSRPDFIPRVKRLVDKGQVTLLTGGFYEPIFPVIPDRDKIGQINLLTDYIRSRFGSDPKGLWIAERVWYKGFSGLLLKMGLGYAILDENHLKMAGVPDKDLKRGYVETGSGFKVFGASKFLRYAIPFAKIPEVKRYFEGLRPEENNTYIVFADDGEKFGFWPYTYRWVYAKGWLESFFEYLSDEKSPVTAVTAEDVFRERGPVSRVEIPDASYSEMMDWSNGNFNNFFSFYPEANLMRNRMLNVSNRVEEAEARVFITSRQRSLIEASKKELYKAQSGCSYWHGIFGGLYSNHLRSGVYKNLINAEKLLDEVAKKGKVCYEARDLDNDNMDEVIIGNKFLNLYIKTGKYGSIIELDNKPKSLNMVNIITRRPEVYHSKLFRKTQSGVRNAKKNLKNNKYTSLYDILGVRERGLKKFLVYDDIKKDSLVDYFLEPKARFRDFSGGNRANLVRLAANNYRLKKIIDKDFVSFSLEKEEDLILERGTFSVYIKKELTISGAPEFYIEYTITNLSDKKLDTVFANEFNWSFMNRRFLKGRSFKDIDLFVLRDEWSDTELRYNFSDRMRLWTTPVYTLNETERGLGKTYQYLSMLFQKPLSLKADESAKLNATIAIE